MALISRAKSKLTDEQQRIVQVCAGGQRCGKIVAFAGTGKTTTLEALARHAIEKKRGELLYLVFNQAMAEEARQRFGSAVECRTAHSLAFRAARFQWLRGRQVVGNWWGLRPLVEKVAPYTERQREWGVSPRVWGSMVLETLARFCREESMTVLPEQVPEIALAAVQARVGSDQAVRAVAMAVSQAAQKVWEALGGWWNEGIPHDAYLKWWQLTRPQISAQLVLFDEAQDASPVMLSVLPKDRTWMVGDPYQQIYCQPAGTRVLADQAGSWQWVPIEILTVGQRVRGYSLDAEWQKWIDPLEEMAHITAIHQTEARALVVVEGPQGETRYAPSHPCIVRVRGAMWQDRWAVALLETAEGWFLLWWFPWRMVDAWQWEVRRGWVLEWHQSAEAARQAHRRIAQEMGITAELFETVPNLFSPQLWIRRNRVSGSQVPILLERYVGSAEAPPLWTEETVLALAEQRTAIVPAWALEAGMEMIWYRKGLCMWHRVKRVSREQLDRPVTCFSLTVDPTHTYIADGVVTHNSWRGAINAMDYLQAPTYYLTQSFRFGEAIAEVANRILEQAFHVEQRVAGKGPLGSVQMDAAPLKMPYTVLCRSNMGVMMAAIEAMKRGDPVYVVGGTGGPVGLLNALLQLRAGEKAFHPDLQWFESWEELCDVVEMETAQPLRPLVRLVDNNPSLAHWVRHRLKRAEKTERLARVIISTAHKAKGREWDRVQMGADWRPFLKQGKVDAEEARLWYVAVTRAKRVLGLASVREMLP